MPNPSSIAAHFEEELEGQRAIASDLRLPKADREAALRRVRSIEDTLGIESVPYNGRPAGEPVRKHIRQTPTAILLPFDGREFLLTKGQRAILVDALTIVLSDNYSNDPDIDQERELLINLFKQA